MTAQFLSLASWSLISCRVLYTYIEIFASNPILVNLMKHSVSQEYYKMSSHLFYPKIDSVTSFSGSCCY